ncbi:DUF4279 domain-containing protein [Robertmurraya sp. Marseille-Q9965]
MNKTNILAEFNIIGDEYDIEVISEQLGIEPTNYYKKGDKILNKEIQRKETCWSISSGYQISLDINDQLEKILSIIKPKRKILNKLREQYKLDYKFIIVIRVEENQSPAIYLENEVIEFANNIKADFDFDLYILS